MENVNRSIPRRQWLQQVGATGLVAATCHATNASAQATAEKPSHWIDAHSHIWTRDIERFPLAKGKTLDDLQPASFTTEELLELIKASGVGKVVLIQHHPFHGWDNRYLADAIARYPNVFRGVGQIDDRANQPGQQMQTLLAQRFTGFRIGPGVYQDKWLEGPGMQEMWQTAAKTRQNMCCLINPSDLPKVDAMCVNHPETPVVIDHLARIGMTGEIVEAEVKALCALAKHRHVRVKASAYYALGSKRPPYADLKPLVQRVIDAFGPQRVMWASDSPYQLTPPNSYAASMQFVNDELSFLSGTDKDWFVRRTAHETFFYV